MVKWKFMPCQALASTTCGRPWRASLWSPARARQAAVSTLTHTQSSNLGIFYGFCHFPFSLCLQLYSHLLYYTSVVLTPAAVSLPSFVSFFSLIMPTSFCEGTQKNPVTILARMTIPHLLFVIHWTDTTWILEVEHHSLMTLGLNKRVKRNNRDNSTTITCILTWTVAFLIYVLFFPNGKNTLWGAGMYYSTLISWPVDQWNWKLNPYMNWHHLAQL